MNIRNSENSDGTFLVVVLVLLLSRSKGGKSGAYLLQYLYRVQNFMLLCCQTMTMTMTMTMTFVLFSLLCVVCCVFTRQTTKEIGHY